MAPHGFMSRLSQVAADAGALVIADEVLTGMGRCGSLLASDRVGLKPDLICLGKALGGGLPLSACVGRRAVMDAWPASTGEAVHTSTFLGHPLACATSLAVLEVLEAEGAVERARVLGGELMVALRDRLSGVGGVVDVRGLGLLLGIELDTGGGGAAPAARVAEAALTRGLLVLPAGDQGEVLELMPTVDLTRGQIAYALDALHDVITEVVA